MLSPVHLSSLPLSGCLDWSLVSSFSAAPFGRKWLSEASLDATVFNQAALLSAIAV